ncbi:hypothetical protein [Actinomadura sp. GTD37]|uniref:recombination directionality factor n=1 Tax=Actinomadura sp. GTD37 TaxID=1778030 RepID=UPI0035C2348B
MPIIDLQRRMRQLGEIRIGHVVDTGKVSQKTGRPIMRPEKLSKFRFTSPSKPLLEQVAALYGGTVQEWTPANGGPKEWEVYSDVDRVPVIIPPMNNVLDAWYEMYKGSKCVRRCDGQREQKGDTACLCDPTARECQITTRLNVMLTDVRGLGVWLLTTHSYYATTELPATVEMLARARGDIDGWLTMEEKSVVRADGKTARFMLPKIDVDLSPGELFSGAAQGAVAGGQRAAVVAGRPAIGAPSRSAEEFVQAAADCTTIEELTAALAEAQRSGFAKDNDAVWQAFVAARTRLTQPAQGNPAAPQETGPGGGCSCVEHDGEHSLCAATCECANGPGSAEDPRAAHIKAAFQARTLDDLTAALNAAQADGFCKDLTDEDDDVTAAFLGRRRALDSPAEPEPVGDRDALWAQIVAAWPGDRTSEIESTLLSDHDVTPATATADQLARFLADIKAGTIQPAQNESGVPF